jgi:hypothetical protein
MSPITHALQKMKRLAKKGIQSQTVMLICHEILVIKKNVMAGEKVKVDKNSQT